jgi:hypothetical protein
VLILLIERSNNYLDLIKSVMRGLHISFNCIRQLAMKLSGVSWDERKWFGYESLPSLDLDYLMVQQTTVNCEINLNFKYGYLINYAMSLILLIWINKFNNNRNNNLYYVYLISVHLDSHAVCFHVPQWNAAENSGGTWSLRAGHLCLLIVFLRRNTSFVLHKMYQTFFPH